MICDAIDEIQYKIDKQLFAYVYQYRQWTLINCLMDNE